MQPIKVTLVQADQIWEDKDGNLTKYESLLEDIDSDLIVLPEMFQTGFSMNVNELGEDFNSSSSIKWLKVKAQKMGSAFYTSLIIEDSGEYYNRGVFIWPDGNMRYYDKRKTFTLAGEDEYFKSGDHEVVVEYKGWKIMLQICYDLRFPEICRNGIDVEGNVNYDLLLYVANWPEKRISHWNALIKARAIENQCYVVGVNRVGEDGSGLKYSGSSQVVDPSGETVTLPNYTELAENHVINPTILRETREKLPFLSDR